jgi:peptidoglycan/LPS O-acetylase OafA/YrhL
MVGGWIGMPLLPFGKEWLFAYGAVFALGILSFLFWKKQITLRSFILLVLIASFVHGLRFNPAQGFVAGMTSILVILPWSGYRWSRGLGEISYSLYLTHGFSGGRINNLGLRFPEEWPIRTGFFFAAGIVSIVFAWGFYVLVEKPSHMASQRIGK